MESKPIGPLERRVTLTIGFILVAASLLLFGWWVIHVPREMTRRLGDSPIPAADVR